jgi:flagellar basal body P-ring formation protein FlgA
MTSWQRILDSARRNISANSRPKPRQFTASRTASRATLPLVKIPDAQRMAAGQRWSALAQAPACVLACALACGLAWSAGALADTLDAGTLTQATALAGQAASTGAPAGTRVEVLPGALDPRLRLAPCARVDVYLPAGSPATGRTRVGLRCIEGATAWNVFLPVTVKVWSQGMVTSTALPAGTVLASEHLQRSEVDWAGGTSPAYADATPLIGRAIERPLAAGAAVRSGDLKVRQWFAAGDTVRLVARGPGFSISSEGQALSHGFEGQSARVRTETGRVVTGRPVGERRMELSL